MSREAESKKAELELQKLRKLPENRRCANCRAEGMPLLTAVVMPFKIFVCSSCKSAHQSFSHRCKSAQMSLWTMEEVRSLEDRNGGGNRIAQERWLRHAKDSDRPREGDSDDRFKDFVRRAYVDERWAAQGDGGGRDRDRGRREEEPERRDADRRRDRDGGGAAARSARGGRGEQDGFDPDAGGGRGGGGGGRAAAGIRPPPKEMNLFDPDVGPSRGAPTADLFDPDRGSGGAQSYAAPPAEAVFNPDGPASFNPNALAASGGVPFNAFASGPQPPQPWAAAAPQAAGQAPAAAAGGLLDLNFDPLGPGPAATAASPGGFDLFDNFVSAAPAAQAPMAPAPASGGCGGAACPMMGGGQAAWGSAGAAPQPSAAAPMGPPLQCAGAGVPQGPLGPAAAAAGMPLQGQQQGQWGGSAQGGVPPHPALGGGCQPGWQQQQQQQQSFPGGCGAWPGSGYASAFGGAGVPLQQQPQQAMAGAWGQQGAAWPMQPCPQQMQAAQMQQPQLGGGWPGQMGAQPQQVQPQQQPQQPVRFEDLTQNLNQLYR